MEASTNVNNGQWCDCCRRCYGYKIENIERFVALGEIHQLTAAIRGSFQNVNLPPLHAATFSRALFRVIVPLVWMLHVCLKWSQRQHMHDKIIWFVVNGPTEWKGAGKRNCLGICSYYCCSVCMLPSCGCPAARISRRVLEIVPSFGKLNIYQGVTLVHDSSSLNCWEVGFLDAIIDSAISCGLFTQEIG